MEAKKTELTWPLALVVICALFALGVVLLRADMGRDGFYQVAFPVYILMFVIVAMLLLGGLVAVVAWALRAVQRSDNANVADAARWRALAEQAKTERAAITNPGRLIEGDAEQIDTADWRYQLADDGAGPVWME